ncbi:DUF4822 domain-containing protein [Ureibacillus aquaedulcis]
MSISLAEKKYGTILEATVLNDNKFTYKRIGKAFSITVEHIPYPRE